MWRPVIWQRSGKTFTTSVSPSVFLVGTGRASSLVPELPTLRSVSPRHSLHRNRNRNITRWSLSGHVLPDRQVCVRVQQPNLPHRTSSWSAPEHAQCPLIGVQMAIRTWLSNQRVGGGSVSNDQSASPQLATKEVAWLHQYEYPLNHLIPCGDTEEQRVYSRLICVDRSKDWRNSHMLESLTKVNINLAGIYTTHLFQPHFKLSCEILRWYL